MFKLTLNERNSEGFHAHHISLTIVFIRWKQSTHDLSALSFAFRTYNNLWLPELDLNQHMTENQNLPSYQVRLSGNWNGSSNKSWTCLPRLWTLAQDLNLNLSYKSILLELSSESLVHRRYAMKELNWYLDGELNTDIGGKSAWSSHLTYRGIVLRGNA